MSVIVELGRSEGVGVESDGAELIIRTLDRENTSDGIVGGISLNDNGHIRHPVRKHRSSGEGGFESGESLPTIISEVPRGIFASEMSEGNHDDCRQAFAALKTAFTT